MPPVASTVKILHSTDGTTIYAEATGEPHNPHVVLLAGLSLSGCVFDDLCADRRLLQKLYIVRYDARGHGRSGGGGHSGEPPTMDAYSSKLFADDFKTVADAFGLKKPVLAGWSLGAAVAADVVAHLPPNTLSGIIFLAGIPATTVIADMAAPTLAAELPGLMSKDDMAAFRASAKVFTDRLFANPGTVPFAVRCLYMGHSLTPDIMRFSLTRPMDVEPLWRAGKEGLPLLVVQGTVDGHREGCAKSVEDIMKPHFKNYDAIWLEGRGHVLHYECPEEVAKALIDFTEKVGGKDYCTV
ncbi:alpha/beta-hydrolase [Mycena rebaudengoi]|nr:alpha/beta-hydrolase [Mycena rebaudengoi]